MLKQPCLTCSTSTIFVNSWKYEGINVRTWKSAKRRIERTLGCFLKRNLLGRTHCHGQRNTRPAKRVSLFLQTFIERTTSQDNCKTDLEFCLRYNVISFTLSTPNFSTWNSYTVRNVPGGPWHCIHDFQQLRNIHSGLVRHLPLAVSLSHSASSATLAHATYNTIIISQWPTCVTFLFTFWRQIIALQQTTIGNHGLVSAVTRQWLLS